MPDFTLPEWVDKILKTPLRINEYSDAELAALKQKLARFSTPNPIVSIVIPVWNEEEGILHMLLSLANTNTEYAVELIIVDNNSTDGTAALLRQLGVQTLLETKQGVGYARTCGLHNARGKYYLSGDSDTLFPPGWITCMTKAMIDGEKEKVYCVHGTYSFLPSSPTPRWQYACYETFSAVVIKKKGRSKPYLNVSGFNCGFIRQKGIEVNGYDIQIQKTFRGAAGGVIEEHAVEDGMMALRLQEAGGAIKSLDSIDARVWTSDRRIQSDGGIKKAFVLRFKKHFFKN